jgi:RNA polymerase sigma-70 factor (ECF subfamily)
MTTGRVAEPRGRPDAELVAAVAAGDRRAFGELYSRHAPWLVARLGRRCADNGLVDEAVQDTFVAVWRGAAKWTGRGEVAAWIWGIGVRRLIDGVRRPRPIATAMAELVGPMARRQAVASAEEQVLLGTQSGDAGAALDRLSPELRAVVQATVLDGLTTREASRLLGIPAGTVKTRMMRARTALREDLA